MRLGQTLKLNEELYTADRARCPPTSSFPRRAEVWAPLALNAANWHAARRPLPGRGRAGSDAGRRARDRATPDLNGVAAQRVEQANPCHQHGLGHHV